MTSMISVYLKRIWRSGWQNFRRNQGLSALTVLIMFLTVSLVTLLFLAQGLSNFLLNSLENRIDISVYFKGGTSEQEILQTQKLVQALPGVKQANYVSPELALAQFKERQKSNNQLQQALDEVGENPFLASLNIRAADEKSYAAVTQFLEDPRFSNEVESVDYAERQTVIDKFYSLKNALQNAGLLLVLLSALVAWALAFTTVRLAIYSAADEIGIMRLVGASNSFIRLPFLVQGLLAGLLAAFATLILFLVASFFLSGRLLVLSGGFNLGQYFLSHIFIVIGLEVLTGAGLGVISSLVAVNRYLDK